MRETVDGSKDERKAVPVGKEAFKSEVEKAATGGKRKWE